jgi:hypothetical protein
MKRGRRDELGEGEEDMWKFSNAQSRKRGRRDEVGEGGARRICGNSRIHPEGSWYASESRFLLGEKNWKFGTNGSNSR